MPSPKATDGAASLFPVRTPGSLRLAGRIHRLTDVSQIGSNLRPSRRPQSCAPISANARYAKIRVFRELAPATPLQSARVMHYVYLLQSAVDHRRHYTGFTHNLRARLASHNAYEAQYLGGALVLPSPLPSDPTLPQPPESSFLPVIRLRASA
jgi:hypothetical protein